MLEAEEWRRLLGKSEKGEDEEKKKMNGGCSLRSVLSALLCYSCFLHIIVLLLICFHY